MSSSSWERVPPRGSGDGDLRRTGHEKRLDRETLRQGNEEGAGSDAQARENLRVSMISMTVDGALSLPHHQP